MATEAPTPNAAPGGAGSGRAGGPGDRVAGRTAERWTAIVSSERAGALGFGEATLSTHGEPCQRPDGRAQATGAAAVSVSFIRLVSIAMPGPIVVATVSVLTYLPLAADGLARRISSTAVR
jgi:hypothetical protein